MMKSIFALVATVIVGASAQARSLHPCTPVIQAQPTYIECRAGNKHVSITINTLMSDSRYCQDPIEYKTAEVEVKDGKGRVLQTLEFNQGQFSYRTSATGDAKFHAGKLRLNQCVTPIHGGVSFGN